MPLVRSFAKPNRRNGERKVHRFVSHRGTESTEFFGAVLAASRKSLAASQPLLLRPPSGRNDECKSAALLFHANMLSCPQDI